MLLTHLNKITTGVITQVAQGFRSTSRYYRYDYITTVNLLSRNIILMPKLLFGILRYCAFIVSSVKQHGILIFYFKAYISNSKAVFFRISNGFTEVCYYNIPEAYKKPSYFTTPIVCLKNTNCKTVEKA